jgi:hypothetical protein
MYGLWDPTSYKQNLEEVGYSCLADMGCHSVEGFYCSSEIISALDPEIVAKPSYSGFRSTPPFSV